MDVLYVVRPGPNEELRYSLRSLSNLWFSGHVWIAGSLPDWCVNVKHIDCNPFPDRKGYAIVTKRQLACEQMDSDWLVSMEDDIFVTRQLRPLEGEARGTLEAFHHANGKGHGWWGNAVRATYEYCLPLQERPMCYDLHRPTVFNREKLAIALDEVRSVVPGNHELPLTATVYGNRWKLPPIITKDFKVKDRGTIVYPDTGVLSTNEFSFASGKVGSYIRTMYPKPSPYERG